MKKANLILIMSLAAALATGQPAYATGQTSDNAQASQAKSQAEAEKSEAIQAKAETEDRVEAEYQKAMAEANRNRSDAQVAVAQARAEIEKVNKEQRKALLLQAGDVVLSLHGTEVNSPAESMRALREFAPGEALEIDIKRKRKNQTLSPVISDEQARFFVTQDFQNFQVIVSDNGH